MVGRKVQDGGDVRTEGLDGFELKAGDFEHDPGIGRRVIDKADGGRADVAADQGLAAAGGDDFAGEAGGGGLAVRAGDGERLAFEETGRQFDFANNRRAFAPGLGELREIGGHSRADDDEVLVVEGALAVLAGFDRDALFEQRRNFILKLLLGLGIGDGDARAARLLKTAPRRRRTCRGRRPERFCRACLWS